MTAKLTEPPRCPYCRCTAEKVTGQVVYPRRRDLWDKIICRCELCDAWVGCHPGTDVPLGRLADADLRTAKQRAHAAFDPLWKKKMERDQCGKGAARRAGYTWLAEQLGIRREDCHIGMMDVALCERVVEVCQDARR